MSADAIATPKLPRDVWVTAGMAVAALAAAASSFTGLRGLAVLTGWPSALAPLLPIAIDSYAMTSMRVWLTGGVSSMQASRFAQANAFGAILLSLAGNAAYHLVEAHLLRVSALIVLGVGAVPPVILGAVSHMAALRTRSGPKAPEAGPSSATKSGAGPQYGTEDELLAAARLADTQYRAEHDGKPITRDELRRVLRVGGARATTALRVLRAERDLSPGA